MAGSLADEALCAKGLAVLADYLDLGRGALQARTGGELRGSTDMRYAPGIMATREAHAFVEAATEI